MPVQGVAGAGAGVFQPAAAQVPAAAPAGGTSPWVQVTQGGQTYFYNPQTGVTAWTIPGR